MFPFRNCKPAAALAAALAATFLVTGCVDHDGRYSGSRSSDSYYRGDSNFFYSDDSRSRKDGGYYRDGKRYHSYEHYRDEQRNRAHKEQEKAAWDR